MMKELKATRQIAVEDIQQGDYITVSHETLELLLEDDASWKKRVELITCKVTPCMAGYPFKVVSVCLPFLLVELPDRRHITIDLRRYSVVRLDEDYGRKAFKCMRPAKPKKRR